MQKGLLEPESDGKLGTPLRVFNKETKAEIWREE